MHASAHASTERLESLLALALSRPHEALAEARQLADSTSDPLPRSYALQASGIVLRDSGQLPDALADLRGALRAARLCGRPERVADVRATLGAALVMAGRTRSGLAELDAAASAARGRLLATVLMRRAYVLSALGRYSEALADMRRALAGIRAAGDRLWEGRALNNRATIHILRGALTRAERDVDAAEQLFRAAGQELEVVLTVHNRGVIAYCRGDLPTTLSLYDEAARRFADLSVSSPALVFDRCNAFLAAGLTAEAVSVVQTALAEGNLAPTVRAELLLVGANAALADGDARLASTLARAASELFRRQGREAWQARAELALVRARRSAGETGREIADAAATLSERLRALRSEDAPVALLVAGQLAAARGLSSAHARLEAAARYRHHGSGLVRATGWLARAVDRAAAGDTRGLLSACSRGLDALDEHRMTLGSSELRALATRHGEDLAGLALRQVLSAGTPRSVLMWTERWRATTLADTPVLSPHSTSLVSQLGALRSQTRRLEQMRNSSAAGAAALEHTIRAEQHQLRGVVGRRSQLDVPTLLEELADDVLVELLEVDGVLHAVTVSHGRIRRRVVGEIGDALAAVAAARYVLRQAARGRPTTLGGIGERLQAMLLGPEVESLGGGRVVVAPPARLHDTPWGLMPALADRAVSVVPSAGVWQRARAAMPSSTRKVLIAGPDLPTGGAEVAAVARSDPAALLLRDGAATVSACLAALDGAALAHIAAHGRFRRDSPMFSSLLLDDGPLTVHDLEQLTHPPHRLVLSACDSGVMAPVGANELLGLGSALLSVGTAGIVASIAEVNDEATASLMVDLHRDLSQGAGLSEALLLARGRARGEPVAEATAAAFVAVGV